MKNGTGIVRQNGPRRFGKAWAAILGLGILLFLSPRSMAQTGDPQPTRPQQAQGQQGFKSRQEGARSGRPPQATIQQTGNGKIMGVVKAGNTPLPGATVMAVDLATRRRIVTLTDTKGQFLFTGLPPGQYFVVAQMAAFAPGRGFAELGPKTTTARVDVDMILASRAPAGGRGMFGGGMQGGLRASNMPGASGQGQGGAMAATEQELQSLAGGDSSGESAGETTGGTGGEAAAMQGVPGLQAGASDTATESVAVSGNTSGGMMRGLSSEEIQERVREFQNQRLFQSAGGLGGRGGFGGGGGGRGVFIIAGGGRGRGGFDQPHGAIFYSVGDSDFDAAPYALSGIPAAKPAFIQHNFGITLGGPLNIPKIYKGGAKNFFFASYNGSLADNPFSSYSTVPTLAERQGIFSNPIYNPQTGMEFSQNTIPQISPQAAALLPYIPLPNVPGRNTQNFYYTTTSTDNSNNLNFRLIHNFGATSGPTPFPRFRGPRNNLNIGFHYRGSNNALTHPFPTVGGSTTTRSFDLSAGYARSFGKVTNIFNFDFNRNRINTQNLYAFLTNIEGQAGIGGVSTNPFNWGLPNLTFSDLSGIQDVNPVLERDQTFSYSDSMIWTHGKHTLRWGGDFRRIQVNPETSSNPRGSFTFTGFNTAQIVGGQPVTGTGNDFADFLLGLPQQTAIQTGANTYHFRGNSWDLFGQDDWRVRGNFSLNLGLRYEYVSPMSETNNQLVNLDIAPGFVAVAPVQPGQSGPYTGPFPKTLVNPDRNNFAPRVGLAWKPLKNTVVRAGYGIDYNTQAYHTIAQQLAYQPPFSITETNIEAPTLPLSLAAGFPAPQGSTITNNFAVNRDYRLGYAQIWNLDVQQELSTTLLLNVDYTGTKGTNLDMLEDPNRGPNGLLIPGVQAFTWESSVGDSILHAGTVRLRRRLADGVSVGGSYTYSKSIDNASDIGGGASTVAQNAQDLAAERGLSSFDQTHRFTGDYLFELPFGHEKRWLAQPGVRQKLFGDWEWSGDWTIASGFPFTVNVQGDFSEIDRGTNGTLRADPVSGQAPTLPNPSTAEWFNTAAFIVPPSGTYGTLGRNTLRGPSSVTFDMAMSKVFPLGESRMLEIRAQADNVFNHPVFSSIDTTLNTLAFGQVTGTSSMRTIQIVTRFRF
jgi:trimeric autotransporter adhesin